MQNPFYPLVLCARNYLDIPPNLNIKYPNGLGLCNQLFSFINGLLKCINENKKYAIIDCFSTSSENGNMYPIGKIIDLSATNIKLKKIPRFKDVLLFDRTNICLDILHALYGIDEKQIDVTDRLQDFCNRPMPNYINMNNFFANDPCSGKVKILNLMFKLNEHVLEHNMRENDMMIISINYIKNEIYRYKVFCDFGWYNRIDEDLFVQILKQCTFTQGFYDIVNEIKQMHNLNKVNFVHFLIENDALSYWSRQNKMTKENFEKKLFDKYDYLLDKYTNKNDTNYILSHHENVILDKLGSKYNFIFIDIAKKNEFLMKYFGMTGREMCGVIDLLLGINCSKLFIGCHNLSLKRGSMFSYVLTKSIDCKKILFDLDSIEDDEQIIECDE